MWQLTWPVIVANITIPMVGVADVAVMGRVPHPHYIAAITMGATMFSAVYWIFGFLRMGTTGLASQAFGRGDLLEVVRIGYRAATVALGLGLLIVTLQWPLAWGLFRLFDASTDVAALAGEYYAIRIYGAPGLLLYLVELGMLFGLQRMKDTLYLSIGLNVSNLLLDVVLVLGLQMGVSGVAWGTLISEWGAAAGGSLLLLRALRAHGFHAAVTGRLWAPGAALRLFHISGNLVLRTFFVQLPFFAGTVFASRLSDATLAAHGVLMQLFFIMTYSLDGFAHTAETMAGYSYGAGNATQLRNTTRYCAIWAMVLALATALIYVFGGEYVIAALTTDPDLQQMANRYLPWVAAAPLVCVWAFLFDGIFIGTTHIVEMRNAMLASAAAWAVCLALSYPTLAYHAVWLSMSVFMLVRSVLMAWYYPRIQRAAASN